MKRIVMHWTAGGHKANGTDKRHYHDITEEDGTVVFGNYPIQANQDTSTPYAAHTRGLNTDSIGMAMAGMRQAKERPFNPGPSPLSERQVDAFCTQVAKRALEYNIPVTRETVLPHAEVQPTLGVWQRNKWDITWLPGMDAPGDPIQVGDELRRRIQAKVNSLGVPRRVESDRPIRPSEFNPVAALVAAIKALLKGRKSK